MTISELTDLTLFRRIIDSNDNSITLDNGVRLIHISVNMAEYNKEITSISRVEDIENIEFLSNQEVICNISDYGDIVAEMPVEEE